LTPADFWLFPELKNVLKGKRFSDFEDIKSCVRILRMSKTILNNSRSAGNIAKNWREITFKNSIC
jgi:hypothetical protein